MRRLIAKTLLSKNEFKYAEITRILLENKDNWVLTQYVIRHKSTGNELWIANRLIFFLQWGNRKTKLPDFPLVARWYLSKYVRRVIKHQKKKRNDRLYENVNELRQ